jgi:hypothetical protein
MDFALSFLNCFLLILILPDISVIGVFPNRKENKVQLQLISTTARNDGCTMHHEHGYGLDTVENNVCKA